MLIRLKNNPTMIGFLAAILCVVLAATVILPVSASANGKIGNAPHQSIGGGISANWAGYVVPTTDGAVSSVSGSWVVPAVTGNGCSAIWLGMDGYSSNSAEQIGTEQDIINGKARYYAWFEMYPNAAQKIDQPVNAGDTITASVKYTDGNFVLTLRDNNWPTVFNITETPNYTPQRNSAEWIIEAPATVRSILPLADFGTITFNSVQATIGGETSALSNWMPVAINMGNLRGEVLVQTDNLNATGDSFTASYIAISSVQPVTDFTGRGGWGHNSGSHRKSADSNSNVDTVTNFNNQDGQGHNSDLHDKSDERNRHHPGWAENSGKSHEY